jgi:acyl-coenzyme A synthetase/AMP-(fatty) acid ligase
MITTQLEQLLSSPGTPEQDFIPARINRGALFAMADHIRQLLESVDSTVCLATENRAILAAASLAALASPRLTPLVLPYSLSLRALNDIHEMLSCNTAITDQPDLVPPGMTAIVPNALRSHPQPLSLKRDPNAAFLQFFTGGSTGTPKRWLKTPRNLFGEALFHARRWAVTETDRILSTTAPFHIYGFLFTVLLPLVSGASVEGKTPSFPQEIREALTAFSPTILVSVPMHYRILNGGQIPAGALRLAFSSAGKLPEKDGAYFHRETGIPVIEVYGSTETGGIAFKCAGRGERMLSAFDVLDWKISDETLCVRSGFISPELPLDREGYYQTQDRVKACPQSGFELLGRADGIVKIGGKRVDLEEVQAKIRQLPGVIDAAVVSIDDNAGRESRICAMVQTRMERDALRRACADILEPHAVPKQIEIVDRVPLMPTGKYDHAAIRSRFEPG